MVRLPNGMRERISEAAEKNSRSMNAEIVSRLESSFDPANGGSEEVEWLNGYIERLHHDKVELIKALNTQDKMLSRLNDAHRTLTVLARSIGQAFLEQGPQSDILKILAEGLSEVNEDLSSDPSEPIPLKPWED